MPEIMQYYRLGGYTRRQIVSVAPFLFALTKKPGTAVKKLRSAWILFTAAWAVKIKKKGRGKVCTRSKIFS